MRRHPSRSILRRIQDEPEAVAEQDRAHAASCTRCRRHSEAMAATAATAAAVLGDGQGAVDPAPALRRLRSSETGVVPPKPGALDRLRSRLELGRRRALRTGAEQLVDGCLDLLGPVEVNPDTKEQLLSQANEWGQISWNNGSSHASDAHVGQMLQLIVATREYQFA